MRRVAAQHSPWSSCGALLVFGTGASGDGERGLQGPGDLRQRRLPGARRGGPRRRRKVGSVSEVDVTGPGRGRRTRTAATGPGQGRGRPQDHRPGVPGLPPRTPAASSARSRCSARSSSSAGRPSRAPPGTEPPPSLEQIADGEPGEGQCLLPIERNAKAVDLDLVNNIMREPYPDRFRLILNDLGAGLAARGDDLAEIVERANPALRQTNRVLAILAEPEQGAGPARDATATTCSGRSPAEREPASRASSTTRDRRPPGDRRARRRPRGRASRSSRASCASCARRWTSSIEFSTQSTPVVSDLGDAAPGLNTGDARARSPFADAGIPALKSLGDAADEVGPELVASEPGPHRPRRARRKSSRPTAQDCQAAEELPHDEGHRELLRCAHLLRGRPMNGFDSYGHFAARPAPGQQLRTTTTQPEPSCRVVLHERRRQGSLEDGAAAAEPRADQAHAGRSPGNRGRAGRRGRGRELGRDRPGLIRRGRPGRPPGRASRSSSTSASAKSPCPLPSRRPTRSREPTGHARAARLPHRRARGCLDG